MSVSKNCLWDDFRDSNHNDEPIFYNQNVRNKYFTISYIINFCMWSTKMILLAFFCTIWAFASQFVLKVGVLNSWLDNINWRKILITGLPGRALSRKPLCCKGRGASFRTKSFASPLQEKKTASGRSIDRERGLRAQCDQKKNAKCL